MRKIIISFLFCCTFYFAAVEIFAQCSCVATRKNITAYDELILADAVFAGKVIEVKKTHRDSKTGNYTETVKFEITKAWKQDLKKFIIVSNKVQGCVNGFDENEEFLVYGYKNQDGTFGTLCCCSRTKLLSKADGDLKDFENYGVLAAKIIENSIQKDKSKP